MAESNPVSRITTPITTDLASSVAVTPENGDYFGQSWAQSSPPRLMGDSVRQPPSPYSPDPLSKTRIKPGSKNSFAKVTRQPAQALPQSSSMNSTLSPSESPLQRDEQELRNRRPRDDPTSREASSASNQDNVEKVRRKKTPSQKAMLSQALQKANHAVVLDNAQNFTGAIESYKDACDLLQQVMQRSSGDEEKRKLDAIVGYQCRIKERGS